MVKSQKKYKKINIYSPYLHILKKYINYKKYYPELEDFVIGTIKQKLAEFYIVDIGAP